MKSIKWSVLFCVATLGTAMAGDAHAGLKDKAKGAQEARGNAKAAQDKAKQETEKQKAQLRDNLKKGIATVDKQVSALKGKVAKLPEAQRANAEAAFAAYDQAKAIANTLIATIDTVNNIKEASSLAGKVKEAIDGAQQAAKAYKSAVEAKA